MLDKLNEDCGPGGNPINVQVCNPVDVSGIISALDDILVQVTAVNDNTDTLEASFATAIAELQAGNVDLAAIEVLLTTSLTELQAINANTDTVEALITSLQTVVQNEFDATQALLQTEFDEQQAQFANILTELQSITAKLNEDCGPGGDPINVQVCNPTDVSGLLHCPE